MANTDYESELGTDDENEIAPEDAREAYVELAKLAGSLAHELKTPVSVIVLNMELLEQDVEKLSSPEAARLLSRLATCKKHCERLQTLLDDFLRFAKLSRLELKPGDLNRLVHQVLDFFEPQASKQEIEIVRHLDPELPTIMMESHTLQAAIINLVKNALEAMPDGGTLVVRSRLIRGGAALDIVDTGHGMDGEALLKMFDYFYTQKQGGSGLGLPTAKKIIEAHGGRINVQSEVNQGTQFTLEFPLPKRIAGDAAVVPE